MKIKRKSWHYKISNLGSDFENRDDNLCCYFWRLVGKAVLLLAGLFVVGAVIYAYFTSLFVIPTTIMIIFIVSSIILPILAIYYFRERFGKPLEIPGENILFEYLKAKKRKVCHR